NPPATSTGSRRRRSSACCRNSTASTARPSSWSPTTPRPPATPPTPCTWTRACWSKHPHTPPEATASPAGTPRTMAPARSKETAMKYLHLIWAALFRRKVRTFLTLASIVAAFLLFGLLDGMRTSFADLGRNADGAQRLQTASKLSFIETLPLSLLPRISAIDDVE